MPDEGFGVAAVGLEHLERLMPGHVGDLDQVRATLHRARHEAGAEGMATEGRWVEAETGSTLLHDRCDIPRRQAPIGDPHGDQ